MSIVTVLQRFQTLIYERNKSQRKRKKEIMWEIFLGDLTRRARKDRRSSIWIERVVIRFLVPSKVKAITITMASPRGCIRSSCDISTGYDQDLRSRIVASPAIASSIAACLRERTFKPCSCVYMFIDSSVPRQSQPRDFCAARRSSPDGCQVFVHRFNDGFSFFLFF